MSSFPESASRLEELEAGLAALQSENYPGAIAQLSEFLAAESNLEQPNALKARIGIIRAKIQSGQTESAIALCQELQNSQNEQARAWATQTIAKLTPVETGFVPIEPKQKTRRKRVQQSQPIQETQESIQETQESTSAPSQAALAQPEKTQHVWQNAGRAQRWQPLRRLNPARLQWAEIGTVVMLFLTLYGVWSAAIAASWLWFWLQRWLNLSPIVPEGEVPGLALGLSLVIAFVASPWILDGILKLFYGLKPLSTAAIARHSAESHRLLQRFSQQQKIPMPKLGILPTQTPLSFTYGCLPRFARIVVSQGLVDSLTEEEIAAIYGYELGHIAQWNFIWMSLIAVALQIPYTLYQQCAIASDSLKAIRLQNAFFTKLFQVLSGAVSIISALSYGFFSLFRYSGLWLSRQRIVYSDRQACNLTGNPNALARALVKIAIVTDQTIQHKKHTSGVLESFELLSPISYRNAVTFASLFNHLPISTLFQWEQANRNRIELMLNQSHSLLGIRLNQLINYCQEWHIAPEFEIDASIVENRQRNLVEIAPWLGILLGNAIALLLWSIAYGLHSRGIYQLNWLASDYSLFTAFSLIGFGLGMLMRFNRFFPESQTEQTHFISLLTQPTLTPIDSPKIRLEGTLIGRTGTRNQLGQDLILQTESGLIPLNYCSQFGAIGNLFCRFPIGQPVTVTGWLRRNATPSVDVDTLRSPSLLRSGHQIWSVAIALATILLGLLQIL
jgi:Zn-dependent protease with chaperone function